jgi:DNA (cytosine-5)-methyltransferase 1
LIFVGGIESNMRIEKNKQFSRNYKQGYRVYSSDGIACLITVNGGGLGGSTGLYIIDE